MTAPRYGSHVQNLIYWPVQLAGQYTATAAEVWSIDAPFDGALVFAEATAKASGGTSPTLTVMIQSGTTNMLSSAISVTAGARAEGTIATAASTFTKDTQLSLDLTIGGTNPTWDHITVLLGFERR